MCFTCVETPVGPMGLWVSKGKLVKSGFIKNTTDYTGYAAYNKAAFDSKDARVLSMAREQLREYFFHTRTCFNVPLCVSGTSFRIRVFEQLMAIPYGETRSYGEIAGAAGSPKAFRAVGTACAKNMLALFIPCHRVVAAHGMGGFGGGLHIKEWLLKHEKST